MLSFLFSTQQALKNRHSHFTAEGKVITHTHPLHTDEKGFPDDHDHSSREILFYFLVTFDLFSSIPELLVAGNPFVPVSAIFCHVESLHEAFDLHHPFFRGPPPISC